MDLCQVRVAKGIKPNAYTVDISANTRVQYYFSAELLQQVMQFDHFCLFVLYLVTINKMKQISKSFILNCPED